MLILNIDSFKFNNYITLLNIFEVYKNTKYNKPKTFCLSTSFILNNFQSDREYGSQIYESSINLSSFFFWFKKKKVFSLI